MKVTVQSMAWCVTMVLWTTSSAWAQGEGPVLDPFQTATQRSREVVRSEAQDMRRAPTDAEGACRPIDLRTDRTRAEVQAHATMDRGPRARAVHPCGE